LFEPNLVNTPRVQLSLELLQHRRREIKCIDDVRLYPPLAERVQKGEGRRAEPGTGVERAEPRTEKLGTFHECSYPLPGPKKGDERPVRVQTCGVELLNLFIRI